VACLPVRQGDLLGQLSEEILPARPAGGRFSQDDKELDDKIKKAPLKKEAFLRCTLNLTQ